MRVLNLITFFVLTIGMIGAEAPAPKEFARLSLPEAWNAMEAARSNLGLISDYAIASVESRRPDLAALCFWDPTMCQSFDHVVSMLPDSPYKQELMVMMLKSDSSFWDNLDSLMRYPGVHNIDKTRSPFRALIQKYLPNATIDNKIISNYEARLQLAGQLEVAIARANTSPIPATSPAPPSDAKSSRHDRGQPPSSESVPTAEPVTAQSKPAPRGSYKLSLIGAIVVAIGVALLLMRKR